jgi:hydroxymethylbilane synthase
MLAILKMIKPGVKSSTRKINQRGISCLRPHAPRKTTPHQMKSNLVIGSRGSKLALTQAEWVKARIEAFSPGVALAIEIIKTTGDVQAEPLSVIGGKGVFTKELEDALLDGRIDIAVHSLKDLPTDLSSQLTIAAVCEREDPRDALVVGGPGEQQQKSVLSLSGGAVVGTSSQRRLAQLKHLRPDVLVKDLRGNVDTRLRKLDEGQYDALILAAAGLRRLGLDCRISSLISLEQMLPAVGQGALAIETRANDDSALETVRRLNHEKTRVACSAERAFLRALGGGCQLPIAGHAVCADDELTIEGLVAAPTGNEGVRDRISGSTTEAEALGAHLAARLLEGGANELLGQYNRG